MQKDHAVCSKVGNVEGGFFLSSATINSSSSIKLLTKYKLNSWVGRLQVSRGRRRVDEDIENSLYGEHATSPGAWG